MAMAARALPISSSRGCWSSSDAPCPRRTLPAGGLRGVRAKAAAGDGGSEDSEQQKKKSAGKQSLFGSVADALDFAQVRSTEDAELLDEAREATKSGGRMTRQQYGALRRKIGGTYKDFFKSYVEVEGQYVEDGWVDKTCRICKKDTRGEPRQVDKLGSSLASYGAYVRPMPFSNEVGLRMLIGGALREATALGFHVLPLFSYYSYHGPVFRVMLRVTREKKAFDTREYRFIGYCNKCGSSQAFPWEELGQMFCPCSNGQVSHSLVVSGPLWTGPLHDADYVGEMQKLARELGWDRREKGGVDLEKLLQRMLEESDPNLPFGYIKLDEIARRAKINSPPLSTLIVTLQKEGYAASRSHIAANAVKTNCPMATCMQIAKELRHNQES